MKKAIVIGANGYIGGSVVNELLKNITNWSEYQDIKDQYLPIYKNEKQVKIEAIGKLIAKSLVKNYKISGLDQTLLDKAIKSIREFIEKILDSLNLADVMQYNDRVADHIALNILMGNKDYIAKISNTNPKLDYEKALNANPFAERIIKTFTNLNNFKLTGSIALAGQGETIHRPSEEPIHDIDFEVNSLKAYENIEDILGEMNALPYHFGWDNQQKDYVTYAYLIPEKGYKIKINKRDFERGNGWVTDYNVVDSEGNIVEKSSTNHLAIDFFVYKNGVSQNNNSIFKNSQDIYKGKMTISRDGNNERLFQRAKDQEDYILSRPKNLSNSIPAFVYYQLESIVPTQILPFVGIDIPYEWRQQIKENQITEKKQSEKNILNKLSKKFGIKWQEDNEQNEIGRYQNGVVYINMNKIKADTPFHEFAHPFEQLLKQKNPTLWKSLVAKAKRATYNGKSIDEFVRERYPELNAEDLASETIVTAIGIAASDPSGLAEGDTTKGLLAAIKSFFKWLVGYMNRHLPNSDQNSLLIKTNFAGKKSSASLIRTVGKDVGVFFKLLDEQGVPTEAYDKFFCQDMTELDSKFLDVTNAR